MWFLPLAIIVFTIAIAFPLSKYMAHVVEGKFNLPRSLGWIEKQFDTGEQDWKQYTIVLLVFNTALFSYGYLVLLIQPWMPLNPRHLGLLSPTTIFKSAVSFMTTLTPSVIPRQSAGKSSRYSRPTPEHHSVGWQGKDGQRIGGRPGASRTIRRA